MVTVYKAVEVDLSLEDIGPKNLVQLLEEAGCPEDIVKPVREWLNRPVPNKARLEAWKKWVGVA